MLFRHTDFVDLFSMFASNPMATQRLRKSSPAEPKGQISMTKPLTYRELEQRIAKMDDADKDDNVSITLNQDSNGAIVDLYTIIATSFSDDIFDAEAASVLGKYQIVAIDTGKISQAE